MTAPQTEQPELTAERELWFTPLVSAYRRRSDRMHFMPASGEVVTFCGLSTRFLDSGCLGDMDLEEVREQVDVCRRCAATIDRFASLQAVQS